MLTDRAQRYIRGVTTPAGHRGPAPHHGRDELVKQVLAQSGRIATDDWAVIAVKAASVNPSDVKNVAGP
jgi:hypothetical protein